MEPTTDSNIIFVAPDGPRALTNAVFLLGAYMILKLDTTPSDVAQLFRWLNNTSIESYRDAPSCPPQW